MLISIVLLILVIILSLVFKLYIFKFQLFRDNILEGNETLIGGGPNTGPFDSKIAEIEKEIDKLVLEIEKYNNETDISRRNEEAYKTKIADFEKKINELSEAYMKLLDENKEYIIQGDNAKRVQEYLLKLAANMRQDINKEIDKINAETAQQELINTIKNSFDFKINKNLVNIKVDDTYVYFYITSPGYVVCRSNRSIKADYILLGGGGAGGGNHGGGGGAGVIVGGEYVFREGGMYVMFVGNGGMVGNYRHGAKNIYGYQQYGQPSFIAGNNENIIAPGGLYGGGGINGAAINRNNREVNFPAGSGGGGMGYNQPANVRMDTSSGQLTIQRIGSAYRGGRGKLLSYESNAGNGGGGGGAAGDGGNASDTNAGNGGSGIAGQYIPNWLPECNKFMNTEWQTATNNGTIIAGGGGGGAWSQYLCVPGKGGRGGGGDGGGCVYDRGMRGLPRGYNNNGIPSRLSGSGGSCPKPYSHHIKFKHQDRISGYNGQRGVPNTGSGGGGGGSTGRVGGDGGSGLLIIRVKIDKKPENTKGMNQCKWSYSENPGADATCPSFAKFCNGFVEGSSWGTCSVTKSILTMSPKPITYLPLRNSLINLGTEQRGVNTRGNVGFANLDGMQSVFFRNSFNDYLFVDHVPYDFTFAFWLYVADRGGYTAVSYGALNFRNIDNPSIQCDFNGGQHVGFHAALPSRWRSIGTNHTFENRWTHFTYTVNQSNYETKLYINGDLRGQTKGQGRLGNPSYHFILGRSGDNGRAYYGGMHDFIVYNSILNDDQIRTVYELTR